jgi:hypothetical protein
MGIEQQFPRQRQKRTLGATVMEPAGENTRYFLSYSGVKLPLNLVSPLGENELGNRNTYIRAAYDGLDRLVRCEKIVYGEVELKHEYEYDEEGVLRRAVIEMDEDSAELLFDASGAQIR